MLRRLTLIAALTLTASTALAQTRTEPTPEAPRTAPTEPAERGEPATFEVQVEPGSTLDEVYAQVTEAAEAAGAEAPPRDGVARALEAVSTNANGVLDDRTAPSVQHWVLECSMARCEMQ